MYLIYFKYLISKFIFWVLGWKNISNYNRVRKNINSNKKILVLGEPHTHILDFFLVKLIEWYYKVESVNFFITSKHMYPGISILLNYLGAIVVKPKKSGLVDSCVEKIKKKDSIIVQIGPSGTRVKTDRWRSGFYHIALNSDIPIMCFFIDSRTKTFGSEEPFKLTGNYKKDMDKIRDIYNDKDGLDPKNNSLIRIKEEL